MYQLKTCLSWTRACTNHPQVRKVDHQTLLLVEEVIRSNASKYQLANMFKSTSRRKNNNRIKATIDKFIKWCHNPRISRYKMKMLIIKNKLTKSSKT